MSLHTLIKTSLRKIKISKTQLGFRVWRVDFLWNFCGFFVRLTQSEF